MVRTAQQLTLGQLCLETIFRGSPHFGDDHQLGGRIDVVELQALCLRTPNAMAAEDCYRLCVTAVIPVLHVLAHVLVTFLAASSHELRIALLVEDWRERQQCQPLPFAQAQLRSSLTTAAELLARNRIMSPGPYPSPTGELNPANQLGRLAHRH
jgi:hypothetical protein